MELVVFIIVVLVVKLHAKFFNFTKDVHMEEEFLVTMERLNYGSQVHPLNECIRCYIKSYRNTY